MSRHVVIVGAGLAGSLLAVALARDGWRVSVCERRQDPRRAGYGGGRSINLAVSARGIAGLASVGLDREILEGHAIPMPGRMIHAADGATVFQPYSKNSGDAINSFSRGGLNLALINAAARERGVTMQFGMPCRDVDGSRGRAEFIREDGAIEAVEADLVVGADGAYSAVRSSLQRTDRFEYSQTYLGHGYKELSIPSRDGAFAIERSALHIWPRGAAMMIALPNVDGSFTNTLFWPYEGVHSFHNLEGAFHARKAKDPSARPSDGERAAVLEFFTSAYPDAVPLMPTLVDDFFANPTGSLVTVRCWPWVRGKAALLGDAAHAIVPFYGQGMNAAFEDVVSLAKHLRGQKDIASALDAYQHERKPNAEAIADMALANFVEMRDSVGSPEFLYRKKIEQTVHELFEHRVSPQYNLVSFSTVPYTEARRRGADLDRVVRAIAERLPRDQKLDHGEWRRRVGEVAGPLLDSASSPRVALEVDPAREPIDITPPITKGMKVWPGDTPLSREIVCEIEQGANITLSAIRSTVHLGAHADGPNHYGKGADSIEKMPISRYLGPATVLDAKVGPGKRVLPSDVRGLELLETPIVLLRTSTFPTFEAWREDFAALSVELVDELGRRGVTTIGIDTPSVDLIASKDLQAHKAILRHGIAILEGLDLKNVAAAPGVIYELIALPLPLEGFDASPVRAVLRPMRASGKV